MNSWRQAFQLSKLELRKSWLGPHIFTMASFILITVVLIASSGGLYFKNNIVTDVWFIAVTSFMPLWIRPKDIQYQKVNENGLWATPMTMMQLRLPIPKAVLVKSRFVIYFLYSFPIQLILFILIYLLAVISNGNVISFSSYIFFMIIWLSLYISFGLPIADIGSQLGFIKITLTWIGLIIGLIALLIFFHFKLGFGIVYGSILLVQKWPFLSTSITIVIAILSVQFYQLYMKRQIRKLDYF